MTKQKTTKHALLLSALSLLMCVSMLIGTTFAWFTDSVTSGTNRIMSGNLDVDVYYGDIEDENSIEGVNTLFNDVTLWEPGAVAYENLTVVNKGTLALKYLMSVAFTEENHMVEGGYALSQILRVGLVEGGVEDGLTRMEILESVDTWKEMTEFEFYGELQANTNDETVGVVIYWEPTAEDNNWSVNNNKVTSDGFDYLHINLGISLEATQLASEYDSFDNTYDKKARIPGMKLGEALALTHEEVTVTVPASAPDGEYVLCYDYLKTTENADGTTTVETDFYITLDGEPVTEADGITFNVTLAVDSMSQSHKLFHKETEITEYDYDIFSGDISFTTNSFSPFLVNYNIFGREVVVNEAEHTILSGYFEGVNPATLDETLSGDDSEYIAIDYVKDGVKHYAVSARATTVILDDGKEESYAFENGDYSALVKTNMSGQLHNVVVGLKNNAHSTVYILPGVYNQASTAYIRSDMDIVGLGDAQNIKVYKTSSSDSNRHLLNITGSESTEYIEVTIRNLYLNATINTTGGKDNAAVQAYDLAKVKCYDLIVEKEKDPNAKMDWMNAAFYVNSNSKSGAYMYVENTVVSSTYVLSTTSPYRFFYDGLTTKNGEGTYSSNSTYIKNQVMEWNNWEW